MRVREALAYIDQSIFAESRGGRSDARKTIVLMLTTPEAESVEIKSTLARLHAQSYVLFYIFQYFFIKNDLFRPLSRIQKIGQVDLSLS